MSGRAVRARRRFNVSRAGVVSMSLRTATWFSLALYLAVALGLPLPLPREAPATTAKNITKPFPCMNSPCGCSDPDHCWRHCCCHSLTERLQWARRNHVQPPDDVIAEAKAEGIVWNEPVDDDGCNGDDADQLGHHEHCPTSGHVVLSKMLECQGLAGHWLATVISLPPPVATRSTISLNHLGTVSIFEARATSLAADPPTPPPRSPAL